MRVLLALLACGASAAELPVTVVDIHPDGAVVTRSGLVPPGDPVINGLPVGIQVHSLEVLVEGIGAVAAELVVPEVATIVIDPAEQQARDEAADRIARASATVGRLQLRRRLVLAALAEPPPRTAQDPPLRLPNGEQQEALVEFTGAALTEITDALTTALGELSAAETAEQQLDEGYREHSAPADSVIRLPAIAAGKVVTLGYRVNGPSWHPAYRVVVTEDSAVLQREAIVQWAAEDAVNGARLRFHGLPLRRDPLLPSLAVPVLGAPGAVTGLLTPRGTLSRTTAFIAIGSGGGAAGMFGYRSGGGKKRAVGRFGGTRHSESSVQASSSWFARQQRGDGSFQAGPSALSETALVALVYLGAGYDHRIPSKHRASVQRALDWIVKQDLRQATLPEHLMALTALAEAYAMSNDPGLLDPVRAGWNAVTLRLQGSEPLSWLDRTEPFAGPEVLAWAAIAAKSMQTSGAAETAAIQQRILGWSGLLGGHRDRDAARAAELIIQIFSGGSTPRLAPAEVQRLCAQVPTWYRRGRIDLIHCYSLALFQLGGTAWEQWNTSVRDLLVQQQSADGSWNAPHAGGMIAATALASLTLEIYYRYLPAGGPITLTHTFSAVDSEGWPVTWEVSGQSLTPRSQLVIPVGSDALRGTLLHQAIPIRDGTVWRRFDTVNPLPGVLPAGQVAVQVDGSEVPSIPMLQIAPGAALSIPLGSDPRVTVRRDVTTTSDDRGRSREIVATLTYRLEAAADFAGTVEVLEPLPREVDNRVDVRLVTPPLHGDALTERLRRDPVWRANLTTDATATLSYRLRLAADLRPFLEYLP